MTTMQNHFISRDTQNNWDAGLNDPNPRMAVMAMEDGFTMPTAAFKDSIPMTNYTSQELGVSPPTPTPEASKTFNSEEEEEGDMQQQEQRIDGLKIEPETPGFMDILQLFNNWAKENVGFLVIGGVTTYALWHYGRNKE
jgi:hypothetical protein